MPTYSDVVKKSEDPAVFRQIVQELIDLPYSDWTYWERDIWLPAMLRYTKSHVYTETERKKLAELCWFSEPCFGQDGVSVEKMVAICLRYHTDFREDDSYWIVELDRRKAKFVRTRQIKDLASLCRLSGVDLRAA